jgi:AraC-like DNA-binding protein
MLAAWLRLERYLHSRHRVVQTVLHPHCVMHQHISIRAGSTPKAAEDLVVLGVLIALLQSTGCQEVEAALENGVPVWPVKNSLVWQDALRSAFTRQQTHAWRISWRASYTPQTACASQAQSNEADSVTLTQRLQQLVSQTQGETLSLKNAAQHLGQSARSLQRHLSMEGVRYVDVVATSRAQRASHLLAQPAPSLAEIGFACGYTDQAHFCRDFKRRVGMSPLRYRESSST